MDFDLFWKCSQILAPPFTLLLALNVPSIFFRNYFTRFLTTFLVAVSAGKVITEVKIQSPSLAFMIGLLEGWIVIWAAVLLIRYNPSIEAHRRRWSRVPWRDGEYEEGGLVWQSYPRHDWVSRLWWTADLVISFRGVGWHFGNAAPKQENNRRSLANEGVSMKTGKRTNLVSNATKLLRDILVFRSVLWGASRLDRATESCWQLRALHTAIWITTSVPFINICHSGWDLIGGLGQWWDPIDTFDTNRFNPSPWGPPAAIIELGIAGLWGVTWHDYFKFGFQSASDLVIPRTKNPRFRPFLRLMRVLYSFCFSGVIHYCGSYMLPGTTQPSKELFFFLLQGVVVILQVTIYDHAVPKRYCRILNPLLTVAWLCWTEPLIFGDQRHGGMWTLS